VSLEQKKFFESGVAAERARILEELEKNIFYWEFELESEQWSHLRYTYYSSKDIFEIVKGATNE